MPAGPLNSAQVFRAYRAIYLSGENFFGSAGDGSLPLHGKLIFAPELDADHSEWPIATALCGGVFLGTVADTEQAHALLRSGLCEFVVNTVDEALRILKNELRRKQAVSVVLNAQPAAATAELVERGVLPDLLVGEKDQPAPDFSRAHNVPRLDTSATDAADIFTWTLPRGTNADLRRASELIAAPIPASDAMRHNWLAHAAQFLPRSNPPEQSCSLTNSEVEKLKTAFGGQFTGGVVLRDASGAESSIA
jgi:hypothetical protein